MTRRSRIIFFGTVGVAVLAGVACAAFVPGLMGKLLATTLIGAGVVGFLALVFLEVGLSEDRDRARARDGEGHAEAEPSPGPAAPAAPAHRHKRRHETSQRRLEPRRPGRMRGERRRLR